MNPEEMLWSELSRVMNGLAPEGLVDNKGKTWEGYSTGWGFNINPGSRNHNLLGKAINCSRWGNPSAAAEDWTTGLEKEAEGFTDSDGLSWYHEGFEIFSRTYTDWNVFAQLAALYLLNRDGGPGLDHAVRDSLRRIWGMFALTAVPFIRANKRSSGWDWEGPGIIPGGLRSLVSSHINPAIQELYARATGQSFKSKKTTKWADIVHLITDFGLREGDWDAILGWQTDRDEEALVHLFSDLLVPAPRTIVDIEVRVYPKHLVYFQNPVQRGGNTGSSPYSCYPSDGKADYVISRTGTEPDPEYSQDKNALIGFPCPTTDSCRSGSKCLGTGYAVLKQYAWLVGTADKVLGVEYANLNEGEKNAADQVVLTDMLPAGEPTHIFRASPTERLHLVEQAPPPTEPPPTEPEPEPEPPPEENRGCLQLVLDCLDRIWDRLWYDYIKPLLANKILQWILGLGVLGLILLLVLWC